MAKKYENMGDKNAYDKEPQKKKRFTLNPFENMYQKEGKGVGLEELHVLEKPNLRTFFKLLRRKLNYIFSINILMVSLISCTESCCVIIEKSSCVCFAC